MPRPSFMTAERASAAGVYESVELISGELSLVAPTMVMACEGSDRGVPA